MTVDEMAKLAILLEKFRTQAASDRVRPMAEAMTVEVEAVLARTRAFNASRRRTVAR